MTKYILISDLHGNLPNVPEGDVLLIAGDICPNFVGYKDKQMEAQMQFQWWRQNFRNWLEKQPVDRVIMTWGNHDIIATGEYHPLEYMTFGKKKWLILNDNWDTVYNTKIYATPWSVTFGGNWVFNKPDVDLAKVWNKIPSDTDILVVHGPPYKAGDLCPAAFGSFANKEYLENVGSKTLRNRIEDLDLKLVVCGHIHEGYGSYKIGNTDVVNASLLDGNYRLVNEPVIWEM